MDQDKLKLTPEQEQQFEEDGFFLVEDALSAQEIGELLGVIDELYERYKLERNLGPHDPFQMRNIVALHPVFKKIMDHPGMLPLVVDLMGFNIQLRTSHMDVRPPQPTSFAEKELGSTESFFPWHFDQPD
jgi:hypothetical protein